MFLGNLLVSYGAGGKVIKRRDEEEEEDERENEEENNDGWSYNNDFTMMFNLILLINILQCFLI